MNGDLWRDKLDAYVDESLEQEELAGLEDHLRTCGSCAAEAFARLQLKRNTRAAAVARYAPTSEFRLRIQKTLDTNRNPIWKGMPKLWLATSAVMVTLIVVSVVALVRYTPRQQLVAELLDQHVATIASANPVDVISTDKHTVKPWFQGKLPFTFNLPEVGNSPYKLVGGKLAYLNHNPCAQLLYELRKHEISVFILQDEPGMVLMPSAFSEKGFSLKTWSQAGLRYVVISDANAADVAALSEMLRTAH